MSAESLQLLLDGKLERKKRGGPAAYGCFGLMGPAAHGKTLVMVVEDLRCSTSRSCGDSRI